MKLESDKVYEREDLANVIVEEVLQNTEFYGCTIKESLLSELTFTQVLFDNTKLDGVDLSNSKFINCRFEKCEFVNCRLLGIDWSTVRKELGVSLICKRSDLSFSTFVGLELNGSIFEDCKIKESEFTKCDLTKCSFSGSNLEKTQFTKNNLKETNFLSAKNYFFDVKENQCKRTKCNMPDVLNLITPHGVEIENP